jgi:hypothetical protein
MKYVKTFEFFLDKEEFADTTYHWSADERKQLEQLGFKPVADNETSVYVKDSYLGELQVGKIAHNENGIEDFYYKIKIGDNTVPKRKDTLEDLVKFLSEPIPPPLRTNRRKYA